MENFDHDNIGAEITKEITNLILKKCDLSLDNAKVNMIGSIFCSCINIFSILLEKADEPDYSKLFTIGIVKFLCKKLEIDIDIEKEEFDKFKEFLYSEKHSGKSLH